MFPLLQGSNNGKVFARVSHVHHWGHFYSTRSLVVCEPHCISDKESGNLPGSGENCEAARRYGCRSLCVDVFGMREKRGVVDP